MAVTLPRQPYEMLHPVVDLNERHTESDVEMERSKEPSTDCVESLKRPRQNSDSAEEQGENQGSEPHDEEPASKLCRTSIMGGCGKGGGGGGGRRKQSKPLRMCNDAATPADVVLQRAEKSEARDAELELDRNGVLDASPASIESGSVDAAKNDADQSCALCDESFATKSSLEDHVRLAHDLRHVDAEEKIRPGSADEAYPTKYHQLGRELQEVAVGPLAQLQSEDSSEALNLKNPVQNREDDKDLDKELIKSEFHKQRLWDDDPLKRCEEPNGRERNDDEAENSLNLSFKGDGFCDRVYSKIDGSLIRFNKDGSAMDADMMNGNGEAWDPNNKSRIFHPDAYCEICDREFCNKYFLKTHRANKHGIYDGSNGPPSTSSSSANTPNLPEQVPSVAGLLSNPGTSNGMFSIMSLLQQQQQQMQLQQKDFGISSSMLGLPFSRPSSALQTPKSAGLSGIPNPSSPVAAAAMASLCGTPGMSSDYNESNSGTPSNSKPISADMEDYCEFCQKHFCNKYYLRKHKLDVHGVNTSSASQVDVKRHQPAAVQDSNPQRSGTPMKSSGGGVTSSSANPYMRNMANFMLFHPFAAMVAAAAGNPDGSNFPSSGLPPLLPGGLPGFPVSAAHGLPLAQRPLPMDLKKENGSSHETSSGNSIADGLPKIPPEVMQSLGILNAEAYMEMCRKEMLGGLVPGLAPAGDSKKSIFSAGNLLGFGGLANPSGLPGIKREPMSEKADTTEMFRNALFGMSPFGGRMESGGNGLASELMHLDKLNSLSCLSNQGAYDKNIFGNMAAAKLVDRVVCDICNKEVCNKYFLKTHKIKVHGCDPNSLDTAGQERTPSKQDVQDSRSSHHMPPQQQQQQQQQHQSLGSEQILQQLMRDSNSFSERLRGDELANKRMDPEAFCDICNKEFSSKYFLKTHKLNIHGIKTDQSGSDSSQTDNILGRPTSFSSIFSSYSSVDSFGGGISTSNGVGLSRPNQLNGSPSLASAHLNFLATSGLSLPNSSGLNFSGGLNLSGSAGLSVSGSGLNLIGSGSSGIFGTHPTTASESSSNSRDGSEKSRSSKHRDSQGNSPRVTCRVCGKELCNKYFLRTHLAKCHGIISSSSDHPACSGDVDEQRMLDGENGNDSRDASSAHSSERDEGRSASETSSLTEREKSAEKNFLSNGYKPMNLAVGQRLPVYEDNRGAYCYVSRDERESGDGEENRNCSERLVGNSESVHFPRSDSPVGNSTFNDLKSSADDSLADCARYSVNKEHPAEMATKAAIANHIRTQQNRRLPVACQMCDERFSTLVDYEDHVSAQHSDGTRSEIEAERKPMLGLEYKQLEKDKRISEIGANSDRHSSEDSTKLGSLPLSRASDEADGKTVSVERINGLAMGENNTEISSRWSRDTGKDSNCLNGLDFTHKTRHCSEASSSSDNSPKTALCLAQSKSDISCEKNREDETSGRFYSGSKSDGVCYAQPIADHLSECLSGITMQTFRLSEVESDGNEYKKEGVWQRTFVPALVCLPTLRPATEPISVTFTLTPVSRPS